MENSHINEAPPPPPLAAEQLFANVDGMDNNDNDLVAADDGILNGGNGMFDYHYDTLDSLLLYLIIIDYVFSTSICRDNQFRLLVVVCSLQLSSRLQFQLDSSRISRIHTLSLSSLLVAPRQDARFAHLSSICCLATFQWCSVGGTTTWHRDGIDTRSHSPR